jgi:hypothetical protein
MAKVPDKAPENLSKGPNQGDNPRSGERTPMTMKENVVPAHTRPQGSTVPPSGRDHEYKDISFKSIIRFVVVLAVLTVATCVLMWGMFEVLGERHEGTPARPNPMAGSGRQIPPAPRLQVNEGADIHEFRRREDSMLNAYGWLDRGNGVAKIPIDRAMDLIATKGLPSAAGEPATAPRTRDTTGADSASGEGGRNFGPTRTPNDGPSVDRTPGSTAPVPPTPNSR